jgi:hypothetical protein
VVEKMMINGKTGVDSVTVKPGKWFEGKVNVTDKESNELTYHWEILKEGTVLGSGGSFEPRPERVGSVITTKKAICTSSVSELGNYRLYVYISDNTGFVSTANVPFKIVP